MKKFNISRETRDKLVVIAILASTSFVGTSLGYWLSSSLGNNHDHPTSKSYDIVKLCYDTLYTLNHDLNKSRFCREVVVYNTNVRDTTADNAGVRIIDSANTFAWSVKYTTTYIDSMRSKLTAYETQTQAYATLRTQAEKNINTHVNSDMHAIADEVAIQQEMQRIKDSTERQP